MVSIQIDLYMKTFTIAPGKPVISPKTGRSPKGLEEARDCCQSWASIVAGKGWAQLAAF
jgi:hypothetical protein